MPPANLRLEDLPVPIRLRLSALWASLMFCYVYGDYFGLYVPGKVMEMNAGRMSSLGQLSTGTHVAVAMMMAVPSLMVAFSLLLPPVFRWLHAALAVAYAGIMVLTMAGGASAFYFLFGVIEIALSLAILWSAIRWPRVAQANV